MNGRRVIVRQATIWTSQDSLCARIWKLILSRQTKKGAGKISSAPFSWMKSIRIFRFKQRKNFSEPLDGNFHLRQSSCSPRKLLWVHVEAYAFLWFFFFYPIFTETWNFDVVFKRIFRKERRIKKKRRRKERCSFKGNDLIFPSNFEGEKTVSSLIGRGTLRGERKAPLFILSDSLFCYCARPRKSWRNI